MDKAEMLIMVQRLRQLGPYLQAHDPMRYRDFSKSAEIPTKPENQIIEENLVPIKAYRKRGGRV